MGAGWLGGGTGGFFFRSKHVIIGYGPDLLGVSLFSRAIAVVFLYLFDLTIRFFDVSGPGA